MFLLLVLQIDLHEILQLWVISQVCLISPADICISWKFKSEEHCKCKVLAQSDSIIIICKYFNPRFFNLQAASPA